MPNERALVETPDRAAYQSARFRVTIAPGAWRVQALQLGRSVIEARPAVLEALTRAMRHCAGREAPHDAGAADKLLSSLFAGPPRPPDA